MDSNANSIKSLVNFNNLYYRLNGKTLFVNIPNEVQEVAKQVEVGSIITVKHSGVNVHGKLLYPQFYRERKDVSWSELNKPL